MFVAINSRIWPFSALQWQKRMADDADRLLAEFGEAAYGVAADHSWREDVGLLKTHDPGHWSRVTLEIGRRLAIIDAQPPKARGTVALHEARRREPYCS